MPSVLCSSLTWIISMMVCCNGPLKLHTYSWWSPRLSVLLILSQVSTPLPGQHATTNYVTDCSACVRHCLCGRWCWKQRPQCIKWHCCNQEFLCGCCGRWWRLIARPLWHCWLGHLNCTNGVKTLRTQDTSDLLWHCWLGQLKPYKPIPIWPTMCSVGC